MALLESLKSLNPHVPLYSCGDPAFTPYGGMVTGYDFAPLIEYAEKNAALPSEGVSYAGSIPGMEALAPAGKIRRGLFGEMPIQIGWCTGHNNRLNAVEYHKSSEIVVAVTDLLLLLGRLEDIKNSSYSSSRTIGFLVPAGAAVELYATTLHFAPINTSPGGFKAIIILPEKTNEPLDDPRNADPLLFARNKWLVAHPGSNPARLGAHAGITGDNIEIAIG